MLWQSSKVLRYTSSMPPFQKWAPKTDRQSAVWNIPTIPGLYVAKYNHTWYLGYHHFHPTPEAAWIVRELQGQQFSTRKQAAEIAVMLSEMYHPSKSLHGAHQASTV